VPLTSCVAALTQENASKVTASPEQTRWLSHKGLF